MSMHTIHVHKAALIGLMLCAILLIGPVGAPCGEIEEIRAAGVLRHLGTPYAEFITGSGDGLDVELVKLFAQHLGVAYEYVQTSWEDVISDLTGKTVRRVGDEAVITGDAPVRGDLVANGFTILPWRQKIVDFSIPTFPTQIWLVARADSSLDPIKPGGDLSADIQSVKALIAGRSIMGVPNTCLEPSLYGVAEAGGKPKLFSGLLSEVAVAVINGEAEAALLDVPDALIALEKWPGKLKILGPLSPMQAMGVGFSKNTPKLRAEFDQFLDGLLRTGVYQTLVRKYYPSVFRYYPSFFDRPSIGGGEAR